MRAKNGWIVGLMAACMVVGGALSYAQAVPASVTVYPRSLNLGSTGKFVQVLIELPETCPLQDVDVETITLTTPGDDQVPVNLGRVQIADFDEDGENELLVRFSRRDLIEALLQCLPVILTTGEIALTVDGELADGTPFGGTSTIKVKVPTRWSSWRDRCPIF